MLPLFVFEALILSVKHGNAPGSVYSYASYALAHCCVLGKVDESLKGFLESYQNSLETGDGEFIAHSAPPLLQMRLQCRPAPGRSDEGTPHIPGGAGSVRTATEPDGPEYSASNGVESER